MPDPNLELYGQRYRKVNLTRKGSRVDAGLHSGAYTEEPEQHTGRPNAIGYAQLQKMGWIPYMMKDQGGTRGSNSSRRNAFKLISFYDPLKDDTVSGQVVGGIPAYIKVSWIRVGKGTNNVVFRYTQTNKDGSITEWEDNEPHPLNLRRGRSAFS